MLSNLLPLLLLLYPLRSLHVKNRIIHHSINDDASLKPRGRICGQMSLFARLRLLLSELS